MSVSNSVHSAPMIASRHDELHLVDAPSGLRCPFSGSMVDASKFEEALCHDTGTTLGYRSLPFNSPISAK